MISSSDIKRNYLDFYSELCRYFWGYDFVSELVDLESEVLVKFPDMKKVKESFNRLYQLAASDIQKDKDLKQAFDTFKSNVADVNKCDFSYIVNNICE